MCQAWNPIFCASRFFSLFFVGIMHGIQKNSTVCNFFQVYIHASVRNMWGFCCWVVEFSRLKCSLLGLLSISQIKDFPFPKWEHGETWGKNRENPHLEIWKIVRYSSHNFTLFFSMGCWSSYSKSSCFLSVWDWNALCHERKKGGVRHFMKCEMVAFHRPNWEPTFLSARTRDSLVKETQPKNYSNIFT